MRAFSTGASLRGLLPIDQDRVGLLDPGDRGVEGVEIAPRRIQRARRPAGNRGWPSPARSSGPSAPACFRHRTDRRRWRRCGRRPSAVQLSRRWRRRPHARSPAAACRRAAPRAVEPAALQAVECEARLVAEPLLVHVLVQCAAGCAAPRARARRRGCWCRPRPARRRCRSSFSSHERATNAYGFEVSAPTGQRSMMLPDSSERQRLLDVGADFHVLAARGGAEIGHAGHFGDEADAARAMDAARHHRLHQRAEVLVLHRALVLGDSASGRSRSPSPGPAGRTRRPGRRSGSPAGG